MKSILITGGCGFIGLNLIKTLIKTKDYYIRVLDNLSIGNKSDLAEIASFEEISLIECNIVSNEARVELLIGDIRNFNTMLEVTKNIDIVIHLAANTDVRSSLENPIFDFNQNVLGIFYSLESSRINKVGKFLFASSSAVIGETNDKISENLKCDPVSLYGCSKLTGENYCQIYSKNFGLKTNILRFSNIFGIGSKNKTSVIAKFIKQSLAEKTNKIYGDGEQVRDFIYIDDVINKIIKIFNTDNISGEIFQIASGKSLSINKISDIIQKKLNNKNISMNIDYVEEKIGDVKKSIIDISKSENLLNIYSKSKIKDEIQKTIKYFMSL